MHTRRWTFWSKWFIKNYIPGSGAHWGVLFGWANFFCLPWKAITPTATMVCMFSTEEDTKTVSSSSRECSQKAFQLWAPLLLHTDLSYLASRESHVHVQNTALCCTCSFSTVSPTCILKGCAGQAEADAIHKSKPLQNIHCASSHSIILRAPWIQGRIKLGQAGTFRGISLLTPPLNTLIPLKMDVSRKLKIFVFMTKSKKLKTPCGTSYMCCACIKPWVFYTEMLIIIIVLEHFYLPKHLPRTCSPTMEREQ